MRAETVKLCAATPLACLMEEAPSVVSWLFRFMSRSEWYGRLSGLRRYVCDVVSNVVTGAGRSSSRMGGGWTWREGEWALSTVRFINGRSDQAPRSQRECDGRRPDLTLATPRRAAKRRATGPAQAGKAGQGPSVADRSRCRARSYGLPQSQAAAAVPMSQPQSRLWHR